MQFQILTTEPFTDQLFAIPRDQVRQVNGRIFSVLSTDPRPDGGSKKKLAQYHGNVCRLRSGDYRVVYTYGDGWVKLLGVRLRKDVYHDEYFGEPETIDLTGAGGGVERLTEPEAAKGGKGEISAQQAYLPTRIDQVLLERLKVPEEFHPALIACKTEDDLLAANLPPALFDRLMNVVYASDLDQLLAAPEYILQEEDDLIRYIEGDLLGFLLKLSPEQERFVDWGMQGAGPTLVKGGPGTGKSVVALYRVQAIIHALRKAGVPKPRVLFTTYTKALATSSDQLLRRLLGQDASLVEVRTADSVANGVFTHLGLRQTVRSDRELLPMLQQALESSSCGGRDPARGVVLASAPRLSLDYLLEEISTVIEARELNSMDAYLAAHRTGRRVPLNERQRRDIWELYQRFGERLDDAGVTTWERLRRHAAEAIRAGAGPKKYDGVVLDEVQDLDPSLLRLLVLLCNAPNRLFIAADANQSIYGSSFRWTDVHQELRFRGRTEILRVNYRSTREIGVAAQAYLSHGQIEDRAEEQRYVSDGPQPVLRPAVGPADEIRLLQRFFRQSMRRFHLTYGSCAVLVPTNKTGQALAERLRAEGAEATWMTGDDLNLEKPGIKVLNLKSAKGLEFPIVALAGFLENPLFGLVPDGDPEEQTERLLRERRTLFVGMTRAMLTLLVVRSLEVHTPLLDGFDADHWNLQPAAT